MSKVIVVRKTDKTIHKAPLANKAALQAYNNRLPAEQKWIIEEMDEKEADKLPFIDSAYVTASEAVTKVKDLETTVSAKDARIAELEALLAGKKEENKPDTAEEVIAKINGAANEAEVTALLGTDDRKTVKAAAEKKIASFTNA